MRREGRQHGMVRVVGLLPPPFNWRPSDARVINRFESPPTAGMFTSVPSKPTNHSKFTSKCRKAKCGGCHEHPVSKSKNKTKGTYKVRTSDDELNIYGGSSASGMLAILSGSREEDIDDEIEVDLDHVRFHQTEIEESSSSTAAVELAIQPSTIHCLDLIRQHVMPMYVSNRALLTYPGCPPPKLRQQMKGEEQPMYMMQQKVQTSGHMLLHD